MKLKTFNIIVWVLAVIGMLGYLWTFNNLFLALAIIFGVWGIVNLAENFIKNRKKNQPIQMVKK